MDVILYTDGGARGNPGPSAAGIRIIYGDKEMHKGILLGNQTNNQAEYNALKLGLETIHHVITNVSSLQVFMDSELIVKQMNGQYKVKDPALRVIHNQVKELMNAIPMVQFTHIERAKNAVADALVNETLDTQHGIEKIITTA